MIRDKGTLAATRVGALMEWTRILACITGSVDRELLLRNEYLSAENRIVGAQVKGRLALSDTGRAKLADIGFRLGRLNASSLYLQGHILEGMKLKDAIHDTVVAKAHRVPVGALHWLRHDRSTSYLTSHPL